MSLKFIMSNNNSQLFSITLIITYYGKTNFCYFKTYIRTHYFRKWNYYSLIYSTLLHMFLEQHRSRNMCNKVEQHRCKNII